VAVDLIRFDHSPSLRHPALICAFEGWNDAADAATGALSFLRSRWQAQPFAHIDPEPFFDFQVRRPHVTLVDGITRKITWPSIDFFQASVPETDRDAILLLGIEPNFRWREFVQQFVQLAQSFEVYLVVTLGALLADVPHTRDIRVVGTAARPEVVQRLQLTASRYEGPTGIVGILHDAMARAGLESVSLWASVPHYVAAGPNPKATAALVKRLGDLIGTKVDTAELEAAGDAWQAKVSELVAGNPEIDAYVHQLEAAMDQPPERGEPDVPTGESLVDELERFLREQDGGGQDKSRGPA
jgi:proteasome assembly chaperone (PAC2) family protein